MRFIIPEGREKFYQWDVEQRLRCVDLAAGVEIHFSTPMAEGQDALVVKSYEEAGEVWVDVPNELLRRAGALTLYAYPQAGEEGHTAYEVTFPILSREKPGDYIYTPEELHRWEVLEQRLAELEEHGVPSADATYAVELHNEDGEAHSDLRELIGDKLDADQLDGAITTALAQAKESGAFDGVSPTVAVTDITGGHRVTITDVNGAKSVDVMDGAAGDGTSSGCDCTEEVLAETELTFASAGEGTGLYWLSAEGIGVSLSPGKLYFVEFDGQTYETVAVDNSGLGVVGNLSILNGDGVDFADTGEPFLCMDVGSALILYCTKGTGPYRMSVRASKLTGLPRTISPQEGQILMVADGKWTMVNVTGLLPTVTTEDNDKVLQVVDGAWQSVTLADSAVATYIDNYINEALGGEY